MITISDKDLPITVAEKIITGTKEVGNGLEASVMAIRRAFGAEHCGEDMFTDEEIEEIAAYLLTYVDSQKKKKGVG